MGNAGERAGELPTGVVTFDWGDRKKWGLSITKKKREKTKMWNFEGGAVRGGGGN